MRSKLNLFRPIYIALLTVSAVVVVLTVFASTKIFIVSAILWLIAFVYMMIKLRQINRDITGYLEQMGEMLADVQSASLTEYPIPVLVARGNKEIVWYNTHCKEQVLNNVPNWGRYVDDILPEIPLDVTCPEKGYNVVLNGRMFTVFVIVARRNNESMYVLYFIDDHDLKTVAREYADSRPSVLFAVIDNYEEMFQGAKENERGIVMGEIEEIMQSFATQTNALMSKISRDTYLFVIEERNMRPVLEKRFELLDKIRSVQSPLKMTPPMSIGVGRMAASFAQADNMARQSLDMALGRGGDQAAVKTTSGYDFYGGLSKAVEKRNRVRTRVIANALSNIVETSDKVLIMGHRHADLDCLGAAVGVCKAVEHLGKRVRIVLDTNTNLAVSLYERLAAGGYADKIISPAAALEQITRKTLLIVVDTHIRSYLESVDVYNACQNVAVIDHHRKMVGHIDNAVLFYHEPYSSSTCEMVSELLQYMENVKIEPLEAEAMLAGLALDTRNFTMRTGARTFEAAAFLRRKGADTVAVKKMFASSLEEYRNRSELVSGAQLYGRCAIATTEEELEILHVAAPQAADELLTICGVDASFVMYPEGTGVSISARSLGGMNVQLIMEKLGGGGHQTMAGAQINEVDVPAAQQLLITAIDEYLAETGEAKQP